MTKKRFFNESELVFEKKLNGKFQDLTDMTFNLLKVIGYAGRIKNRTFWFCRCKCGNIKKVCSMSLKSGNTKSCGCIQKEKVRANSLKHGHARGYKKSKVYAVWSSMVDRCRNPMNNRFENYGGRGIDVCDRWLKFENFIDDMGYFDGLTLDRKDNDKGYCKENCRWATRIEQANNKTTNRFIHHNGKKLTAPQWDRELGLKLGTTRSRLFILGWTNERALNKNGV